MMEVIKWCLIDGLLLSLSRYEAMWDCLMTRACQLRGRRTCEHRQWSNIFYSLVNYKACDRRSLCCWMVRKDTNPCVGSPVFHPDTSQMDERAKKLTKKMLLIITMLCVPRNKKLLAEAVYIYINKKYITNMGGTNLFGYNYFNRSVNCE